MAGNNDNLTPVRSKAEATERGRAGGIKSGEARRKKRTMREIAKLVGEMPVTDPKMLAALHAAGFQDPITNDDAAFFGLIRKAQSGDAAALKLLGEYRGEYSTRVEVEPVQPKPLIDLTEGKK